MKLLVQLSPNNSYTPSKYYECNNQFSQLSNLLLNFSHPQILIVCDHCQSFIFTQDISVLVEQTKNNESPTFSDLCVRCMSKLVSSKSVSKGRYFVRTPNIFSITTQSWRVLDDILLLKGIQKHGYGNWKSVSTWMQSHASFIEAKKLEKHFNTYLFSIKGDCVDNPTHFRQFIKNRRQILNKPYYLEKTILKISENQKPVVTKKYPQEDIQTSDQSFLPQKITQQSEQQNSFQSQRETRLAIYTPQRDQFLIDYDCFAQSLISQIEFSPKDTQVEIELKEKLLIVYNEKLKERLIKKKFAIDENLLENVQIGQTKEETQTKPTSKLKNQNFTQHERLTNLSSRIFDNTCLNQSFKSLSSFIDSSKRYFVDSAELTETKSLALNYINSRILLNTLKSVNQDGEKTRSKSKKIKDLSHKVKKMIPNEILESNELLSSISRTSHSSIDSMSTRSVQKRQTKQLPKTITENMQALVSAAGESPNPCSIIRVKIRSQVEQKNSDSDLSYSE